jgi:hypothetical protein
VLFLINYQVASTRFIAWSRSLCSPKPNNRAKPTDCWGGDDQTKMAVHGASLSSNIMPSVILPPIWSCNIRSVTGRSVCWRSHVINLYRWWHVCAAFARVRFCATSIYTHRDLSPTDCSVFFGSHASGREQLLFYMCIGPQRDHCSEIIYSCTRIILIRNLITGLHEYLVISSRYIL